MKKIFIAASGILIIVIVIVYLFRNRKLPESPRDTMIQGFQASIKEGYNDSNRRENKPRAGETLEKGEITQELSEEDEPDNEEIDVKEDTRDPRSIELANRLGLVPSNQREATQLFKKYSAQEMTLLAQIQRKIRGSIPDGVDTVIELYRQKAEYETAVSKTKELFPDNFHLRIIMLDWLQKVYNKGKQSPKSTDGPRIRNSLKPKQ